MTHAPFCRLCGWPIGLSNNLRPATAGFDPGLHWYCRNGPLATQSAEGFLPPTESALYPSNTLYPAAGTYPLGS